MIPPLKFKPILKEKVWGGERLRDLAGKPIAPGEKIGESWELSDRQDDCSVVADGPLAGRRLRDLLAENPAEIYANGPGPLPSGRFPLLIKFIHAAQPLSVQVHPDDAYCRRNGLNDAGKTECWYLLQPPEKGVVLGVEPGTTREEFGRRLEAGELEMCLHYEPVEAGDLVFCPAGTLHAAVPPMVFAEIQQNSDITYRVYDWNRVGLDGKPRELHVRQAMEVAEIAPPQGLVRKPTRLADSPFRQEELLDCDKFAVHRWRIERSADRGEREEGFEVLMCLDGLGAVEAASGKPVAFGRGDTLLVPASCREYRISVDAPATLLRAVGR